MWTQVVSFSDENACVIESVFGRCDAGIVPRNWGGTLHPATNCDGALEGSPVVHYVDPSENELVELFPREDGIVLVGPLRPGDALDVDSSSICLDQGVDPRPPALCECSAVACEATM